MVTLTFVFSFLTILFVSFLVFKKSNFSSIVSNPFTYFSFFFFLIHFLMPFLQWDKQFFRYEVFYDSFSYSSSLFITTFSFILIYISYSYFGKYEHSLKTNKLISNINFTLKPKRLLFSSLLIFIIGLYSSYKNIELIFEVGIQQYISDRISLGLGRGAYILFAHWIYMASLIFFFFYIFIKTHIKSGFRIFLAFFIISLISTFFYYGINSNRNSIFILCLNLLAIYFLLKGGEIKSIKSQYFKIGLLVTILTFFFYQKGQERRAISSGYTSEYSLVDALNGAFGNHENIVWLLENKDKNNLYYGETYLAAFTNFIPRKYWPEKPLGSGPRLKNTIYPYSYEVGQENNSSLTTGFITEVLMNFGIFGIFIFSILYGFFMRKFSVRLINSNSAIDILINFYIIICFTSVFLYSEFLGFFARFIFTLGALLIIKFLNKNK